ncbi:unnamed protein product [Cochlearia groenlandica]
MQRNRDGSWTLSASAYGGSGNVNGGYPPQATHVYSNFNLQQQHIINNLQAQQHNLNFHPHQFAAAANVFLPNHRQGGDNGGSRIHGSSSSKPNRNVELMRIDNAVIDCIIESRKSMIASGKSVSSELILAQLQAGSIGLQSLHDVPSFKQLMAIEGKINAFIHCFIGARRIVTLYDLEVSICRNESVYCFDDLELGPLLQHPLVTHYFPSVSGSVGTVKITSEEIISLLDTYLNTCDMEDVKLDEFLSFVAEEKSVTCKEKLGVRIQNLRMYVSFIQETKRQEGETLEMLLTELHQKYHNLSSKKQRQGKSFTVEDLHRKDYCGKHTRFHSSSSDDHLSNSPYPSAAEEKQLGISKKKRKSGSRIHEKSDSPEVLKKVPSKVHQGIPKQEKLKPADDSDTDMVARYDNCSDTSSRTDKPDPSRPMPTKSSSTSGNLAHELTDLNFKDLFQSGTPWIAQAQQTAICNLHEKWCCGMYVSFIQETKRQEGETLEMLLTELHQKYHNLSSKKQRQGKSFTVEDLHRQDYCGKHTRFHSSSSDDHLSNSPYPSAAEEKQLGISKKKRKSGSRIHEKSDSPEVLKKVPSKVHQGIPKQEKLKPADDSDTDMVARYDNCSDTSSRTDKPDPSRPMPTKSSSTSGNLAHELTDLNFKDLFQSGTPWIAQAQQTGKKGEQVAYRYFVAKHDKEAVVRWVNDQSETGLPYDVVIEHRGGKKEYVEVKATVTAGKDYFNLTVNEWQFAYEKGESYSIVHVLLGNSNAILTQHRNVVKLCNDGHLKLLILMPNQRDDVNFGF